MSKVVLLSLAVLISQCIVHAEEKEPPKWWENSIIYQVYPRSFKDSNGDGIGDLNGIASKLEHIRDAGAKALWLSPIYSSPQVDFGYDISNFTDVDPNYGTLKDFDNLVAKAKALGLKVLLDLVPNHSSDQHEWFKKSVKRIKPYDNFYVWKDGKVGPNGKRLPPNNWISIFTGPAWTWNEERKQFYYHQFASAQPDLNYRDPILRKEMENVLTFWLDRGVDGFRIDAIIHLFEDALLRDEPRSNRPGVLPDDYDYLIHLYTKDQDEIYNLTSSWRQLMDKHSETHKSDKKYAIVEAGSPLPLMMKYYTVGVDPFNFMFIGALNNNSRASDYVREIRTWMDNMPIGNSANWVIGNHDNRRVASRLGYNSNRADQLSMLATILPGITVIYNGDEIGMVDRHMTFEETVDPAGCNAGRDRYESKSRDPARTPFQWDNTTSAGFSTNPKTWLPVHQNYKTLNLAAEKVAVTSHFKVFQTLAKLKKSLTVRTGQLEISTDKNNTVLGVVRRLPYYAPVVLLINISDKAVKLDLRPWLHVPDSMRIHAASVKSGLKEQIVKTGEILLPGAASVVLGGETVM